MVVVVAVVVVVVVVVVVACSLDFWPKYASELHHIWPHNFSQISNVPTRGCTIARSHLHRLHQIMEGSNSMLHFKKEVEQRVFIKNDLVASLACDEKARNREAMSHMGRVDIYSQLEKEYSTIHCSA